LAKLVKELVASWRQRNEQGFTEISAGLKEAIAHSKGEETDAVIHTPESLNVKATREKTGMSQQLFCATFGIPIGTLRHWEQGLRPRGTKSGERSLLSKLSESEHKMGVSFLQDRDREVFRIMLKIFIGRINEELCPNGYRAYQEVGMRSLNAFRAAEVRVLGS